uniref:Uncharacterized protein n=1 Tax=Triticum urartu TaxID=4572 RepID=A0A8R7UT50_TRIUA
MHRAALLHLGSTCPGFTKVLAPPAAHHRQLLRLPEQQQLRGRRLRPPL